MAQLTSTSQTGIAPDNIITCQLCHQLTSEHDNVTTSTNLLWSYLYHQNVREALLPHNSVLEEPTPKLTFTLSMGDDNGVKFASNQAVVLCVSCFMELKKLQKFHQDLEQAKKSIESQINRIQSNIRRVSRDTGEQTMDLSTTWNGPIPNLCMAGSSVGKENITQALQFLNYICAGISSTSYELSMKTESKNPTDPFGSDGNLNENDRNISTICPETQLESTSNKAYENQDNSQLQPSSVLMEVVSEEPSIKIVKVDPEIVEQVREPTDDINSSFITSDIIDYPATLQTVNYQKEETTHGTGQISFVNASNSTRKRKRKRNYPYDGKKQCPFCFKFFDPTYLSVHKRIHTGAKPYRCEMCNAYFRTIQTLKVHRKTHTKPQNSRRRKLVAPLPVVKIDPVDVTAGSFALDGEGEEGPSILHPEQLEDFTSAISDQSSDQDPLSESHNAGGTRKRRRQSSKEDSKKRCPTCSKLITRSSFRSHLKIHTGEKPYVCEVCSKEFRQFGTLKRHKMSHTGERAFTCDICSKSFFERRDLTRHRQKMHQISV